MDAVRKIDPLRTRAETYLRRATPEPGSLPAHVRELLNELLLHQIELDAQNDQLRETQLELETARARYRELYELGPVACLSIGPDTRIEEANKAAGMLLGVSPQALLGMRLSALLAPEHAAAFERHRAEVLASERRCSCTVDLVLAGGERREVRIESTRAWQQGTTFCTALIDLTDFNRLQRQLQHAQKLEAMGVLASGLAHDFGNLLMGVIGCADIARGAVNADSPAVAALDELRRTAVQGRNAVSQLLGFSRSDAERGVEQIDLHAAVRAREPLLRGLAGPSVRLEVDLFASEPRIRIEAGQLDQILLNLATNARHAMAAGGVLRIATRALEPNELEPGIRAALGPLPCVLLEVSDTGAGMDERVRARAFEPFFTTKPAGMGTGLGLSMVYGTVKRSGGYCELHSRLGEGTSVRMYFPNDAASDRNRSGTHRLAALSGGGPTVLVVEDDRLVRLAIRHYLEQRGCRVLESSDGQHALARLRSRSEHVDLLLSDVVLPGLKGPEVIAAARVVQPGLRALLISAHAPELLRDRGWFEPGLQILRKPFTCEELHAAVAAALAPQAEVAAAC